MMLESLRPFASPNAFVSMAMLRRAWRSRMNLTRLRFSSDEIRQVEALVANHMKFKDAPHMRESTLKRFLQDAPI